MEARREGLILRLKIMKKKCPLIYYDENSSLEELEERYLFALNEEKKKIKEKSIRFALSEGTLTIPSGLIDVFIQNLNDR